MKERVREAVFNLLGNVEGMHAIDLFAGTGALALEALSRGAERATLIESHLPTAKRIRESIADLGLDQMASVVTCNTFFWNHADTVNLARPWLVFCSPPYAFYEQRWPELLKLLHEMTNASPPGSTVVVESEESFDRSQLPQTLTWDERVYPPAVISLGRK